MPYYLGIDTSNYTTSAALYNSDTNEIRQNKQLLPVKDGALGLRQSDAVFSHVKQLAPLLEELLDQTYPICGVGVSTRPRDQEGSYMPCFLVGDVVASSVAAALGIPKYPVSHQAGHVMAALYSTGQIPLYRKPFIAFHLSGGTTDCLLCQPDENYTLGITLLATSSDLKAGQAVDRVGGMLGIPFPAGPALEQLALASTKVYTVKPPFRGDNPSISGLENKCQKMLRDGEPPCDIARYCLDYIRAVVAKMTENALHSQGDLPLIYAGGVMSNSIIREDISKRYGGRFAQPVFSADNAAGVSILAAIRDGAL